MQSKNEEKERANKQKIKSTITTLNASNDVIRTLVEEYQDGLRAQLE